MPQELQKVCNLFVKEKFQFCLFKCEHIFQGKNKNLDILFLFREEYRRASYLLEQAGFILYLPERVEKYKKMYVKFENGLVTAVHLHRQIAWHNIIILDKVPLFKRMKNNLPSPEDSLLIHTAHALFENFKVKEYQCELLSHYHQQAHDWHYINTQLIHNGWKKPFYKFIKNNYSLSKIDPLKAYRSLFLKKPRFFLALLEKIVDLLQRKLSLRRKGHLIALLGANGAGKSTTKKQLLTAYQPLTNFTLGQFGYYFGWRKSFLSRFLAPFINRKGKQGIFEQVNAKKKKEFDLFQELLFMYNYVEYLWRYLKDIYPPLRQGKLVICDRYFYDLYGQYPYSKKSRILSLLPFPRPNQTFILDADVDTLMKRDKHEEKRIVKTKDDLEGQRNRYHHLAEKINALMIDTASNFDHVTPKIIHESWKKYVRNLHSNYDT